MSSRRADERKTRRGPNILVSHSDLATREEIAGILGRAGYRVDEAPDQDQTLKMLVGGDIHVLLVSLNLPPDGYSKLLDACYDPPPTIVLGEYSDTHMRSAIHDRRIVSVLPTPYKVKDLYDAVETAAGRRGRG
jgi:DNA-binding response OmpR family regulator